jgi:hypothetical protein
VKRWVDAVFGPIFDTCVRRVLEETWLDWEHEVRSARTLPRRIACHVRGSLSLTRAAAVIFGRELASMPATGVWWRVAFWLAVPSFFYYQSLTTHLPVTATAVDRATLALLLSPGWMLSGGSVALLLGALWRPGAGRPATPFLSLAILALATAIILAAWVVPAANQEFRERSFALSGGQGKLSKGAAELTLSELLSALDAVNGRAARNQISNRLVLVVSCPLMILLACQLQPMRRVYRWIAAPFVLWTVGFLLEASWRSGVFDRTLALWGFPAGALIAAIAIGLARNSGTRRPEFRHTET